MLIEIEEIESGFKADLKDLPGSPPIGLGKTKEESVVNLFFSILHPDNRTNWVRCIDCSDIKIVYIKKRRS